MIAFTSDLGPRPVEPPHICPRCESGGPVEVSLRTERVVFYRCADCGHMWIVKPSGRP